jgi:large conductance mechanosensitive channel
MNPIGKLTGVDPAKKALTLLDEFKRFAFKGNVIDLAIGVIIGTAFGKIVDSLVKNVLMPVIGLIVPGQQSYQSWTIVIHGQTLAYGQFLGEVVNFLIVAAVLFIFVAKFLGWMMKSKKHELQVAGPPPLTKDQELLTEIRDSLRKSPA